MEETTNETIEHKKSLFEARKDIIQSHIASQISMTSSAKADRWCIGFPLTIVTSCNSPFFTFESVFDTFINETNVS